MSEKWISNLLFLVSLGFWYPFTNVTSLEYPYSSTFSSFFSWSDKQPTAGSTFGMVGFTCNVNRTCLRTVLENMLDLSINIHPL